MKKFLFQFSILLFLFIIGYIKVFSCTNFLITKGASADGSTMITYAADSHVLYGELYYRPSMDYPEGAWVDVYEWDTGRYMGKIKQVKHTYSVVGNMNEYQVAIGETTYGGRPYLIDTTAILDYGTLMYTALQRAKTAREAITIIGELMKEYGYASSGESFSISDPNEVWIMDMIGKGTKMKKTGKGKDAKMVNVNKGAVWVARRIPDGYISGHANQARITTFPLNDPENCLYAADVISFAKDSAFFKGEDKDFSFSDTYNPVDFHGARFCESRVWSAFRKVNKDMDKYLEYIKGHDVKNRMPLWIKPDKKVTVNDVMEFMRDHFEGTELDMNQDFGAGPYSCPYRWRPLTWKTDKNDKSEYFNERAISTQQTGFSFVTQSRSALPNWIGGILWFGVDDTYSTVYTPMYCGMTEIPEPFKVGNGKMMEFSETSAFWVFNQVSNFAYTRYSDMIPEIRQKQKELESKFIANTPAIDQAAQLLFRTDQNLARQFLTEYSVNQGNNTVAEWKNLYKYLFTKFMDGNIKQKDGNKLNPKIKQPGYGENWYKKLVKETGDKFKVPEHIK